MGTATYVVFAAVACLVALWGGIEVMGAVLARLRRDMPPDELLETVAPPKIVTTTERKPSLAA